MWAIMIKICGDYKTEFIGKARRILKAGKDDNMKVKKMETNVTQRDSCL